jgi:hypothetical protein
MNDIEYGEQGLLTNDISQDRWPYSFRFYDFILLFVESKLSPMQKNSHMIEKKISVKVDLRDKSK